MRIIFTVLFSLWIAVGYAQRHQSDWDAYVMEVNHKPVSIIVDMALGNKAPLKERPYVVIVRTQIQFPDGNGLPGSMETATLDEMEEKLVEELAKKTGALYTGRYTQRGLREFYFYALDTVGYNSAVHKAMSAFAEYKWLSQAKEDKTWTNYFQVLFPPPVEREKIQNRRLIDYLKKQGDALLTSRRIDHFFYFKTKSKREEFLRSPGINTFKIAGMPEKNDEGEFPYLLQIYKDDIPDYTLIEKLLIPLWDTARKHQGRYDGWETYLVK